MGGLAWAVSEDSGGPISDRINDAYRAKYSDSPYLVMPLFLSYPMPVDCRSQSRKWSQIVGESTKRSSRTESGCSFRYLVGTVLGNRVHCRSLPFPPLQRRLPLL